MMARQSTSIIFEERQITPLPKRKKRNKSTKPTRRTEDQGSHYPQKHGCEVKKET